MNVENRPLTLGAAALTLLTAVLWGGNAVAIKIALQGLPPLALAGFRFAIGGVAILLWARLRGTSLRLSRRDIPAVALLIALFVAQIYLLNAGTQYTLAGRSAVFIATYPFFTAIFAHVFFSGDALSRSRVAGMALAFLGVALVFSESLLKDHALYLLGDAMVLGSGVLLGGRQVYTKALAQRIEPAGLLVWQAGLSVPVFFLLSAFFESGRPLRLTPFVLSGVLYQGVVVAGFCFFVLTALLKRYRASRVGVFGFVTPLFGVLLGSLLLREPVSPGLAASVLLVGAGVAVVNRGA